MATSSSNLNDLFKTLYANKIKDLVPGQVTLLNMLKGKNLKSLTVQEWLNMEITDYEIETFPNAKKAQEIKNQPLYKAMK